MRVLFHEYNGTLRLMEIDDIYYLYDENDECRGIVLAKDGVEIAIWNEYGLDDCDEPKQRLCDGLVRGFVDFATGFEDCFFEMLIEYNEEDE